MKPNASRHACTTMLLLLPLLVLGCSSVPERSPPVVIEGPKLPPLPAQARQQPVPEICSPTCLEGWNRLVESLLSKPTSAAPPASPASATPIR
jgi:hypothetical protein